MASIRLLMPPLALAMLVPPPAALAEDGEREARSGADTIVWAMTVFNTECTGGSQARVRITVPPANGSAEIRRIAYTMGKDSRCPGMPAKATAIVYRSRPGFRGVDQLRYERSYELYLNGRGEGWDGGTVTIRVK